MNVEQVANHALLTLAGRGVALIGIPLAVWLLNSFSQNFSDVSKSLIELQRDTVLIKYSAGATSEILRDHETRLRTVEFNTLRRSP
jgi:hypothetical protein